MSGAATRRGPGFSSTTSADWRPGIRDYVDRLVAPYYGAIAEWYETVGIGVTGGELWEVINRHLGDPFFGVGLNPGHLIHLDEWLSSPIFEGSTIPLQSGMAIQVDVIPMTHSEYYSTNIEDGIALADDATRAEFATRYPEAWSRIEARRAFMQEALGIRLKPEVLPFSNMPAYLPPYWFRRSGRCGWGEAGTIVVVSTHSSGLRAEMCARVVAVGSCGPWQG